MINNNINHYYEKHYDKENLLQKKQENISKMMIMYQNF